MSRNTQNLISMFATRNDTDRYVVTVDGLFGFVDSRETAHALFESIGSIDGSAFGSAQVIPPHYTPMHYDGHDMTQMLISEKQPIDIADYLAKGSARQTFKHPVETSATRLERARAFDSLWMDTTPLADIALQFSKPNLP